MLTVKNLLTLKNECANEEIFIKFYQDKIPAFSSGSGWNARTFPEEHIFDKFVLVQSVYIYSPGVVQLLLTSSKKSYYMIFPDDFAIELIKEGKEVDDFFSIRKKKIVQDLANHLSHNHYSSLSADVFFNSGKEVRGAAEIIPMGLSGGNPNPHPYGTFAVSKEGFAAHLSTSWETCLAWPIDCIREGLYQLHNKAKEKECSISLSSIVKIENKTLKEKNSRANVNNVYGLSTNLSIHGYLTGGSRIGAKKYFNQKQVVDITKALDAIVGVLCVSLAKGIDQTSMRTLSSLPGDYIFDGDKQYQYAGLSNFWLSHPFIANMVADLSRKVIQIGYNDILSEVWKASQEETIHCMINSDVPLAQKIIEANKDFLLQLFLAAWGRGTVSDFSLEKNCGIDSKFTYNDRNEKIFSIFRDGITSAIKDPLDLVSNWNLQKYWVQHSDGIDKNVSHAMFNLLNDDSYRL